MQDVDRPGEIEALPEPARAAGPRVDHEAAHPMGRDEGVCRVAGDGGRRRDLGNGTAARGAEAQRAGGVALDSIAVLVDGPVMPPAEQREVVEPRRTAVGPVRVQRKADVFSGSQSRRGKSQPPRSLDGRAKGDRRSEAHRQTHQEDGSESPGRNGSERTGSLDKWKPSGGRAHIGRAKAAGPPASWPRRWVPSGGVRATARWQGHGEQLEKPSSSRRESGGAGRSYNQGTPGKSTGDERVAEGPVVAMKRGNTRRAKGPCCSAAPPTRRKAGAS
jgi:hypothetical protein